MCGYMLAHCGSGGFECPVRQFKPLQGRYKNGRRHVPPLKGLDKNWATGYPRLPPWANMVRCEGLLYPSARWMFNLRFIVF